VGTRRLALATLCATALCACETEARAAIPQGNQLLNGGGETGTAAVDETSHFCPQGWVCDAMFPNTTLVRYGTTTFPSAAESARVGGGNAFFAGGPANSLSGARQTVSLSAQPEFEAGGVKATFGGCLGGFAGENDHAIVQLTFLTQDDPDGASPALTTALTGPSAAARADKTSLLPVAQTVAAPPDTEGFRFTLSFVRDGSSPYNDAYADNLSVAFGPAGGPNPAAPACSVPGGGPGPGPTDPAPGGGGGGKPLKLLGFGAAVIGRDGRARLKIVCNTSKVSRCKGKATAALMRRGKARSLGSVRYSVPAQKSRTVKIKLKPKLLEAIRGLSRRALAKARVRLRTATTVSGVKFTQTASLKLKRPG
jgi:hypothetical protein